MTKKEKYVFLLFVKFVVKELGIKNPYSVILSNDRSKFKTTAYYNNTTGELAVYKKGRALIDIMRSVAHELVHHKQNQDNRLKDRENIPDIGGDIEDEANSLAGRLVKEFGYNSKYKIYDAP